MTHLPPPEPSQPTPPVNPDASNSGTPDWGDLGNPIHLATIAEWGHLAFGNGTPETPPTTPPLH
jgi:hypothetical protein